MSKTKGKVYLIPITMGETEVFDVIPLSVKDIILNTKVFIVENIRTTRRYLKKVEKSINIDELVFFEINKRTKFTELQSFFNKYKSEKIGVISEAGCPGIADPGADVVKLAHQKNMKVIPLVGPSSILMALISSGLNGQNFAFNGYIPINKQDRLNKIKFLEKRSFEENQTQIFIETPFRNKHLLNDILKVCNKSTKLCIASNITLPDEFIKTKSISEWEKEIPDLGKKPTVFLIHRYKQ
jgi:16S rRNA (cytidine1402-2'-O)-methyltransferase